MTANSVVHLTKPWLRDQRECVNLNETLNPKHVCDSILQEHTVRTVILGRSR